MMWTEGDDPDGGMREHLGGVTRAEGFPTRAELIATLRAAHGALDAATCAGTRRSRCGSRSCSWRATTSAPWRARTDDPYLKQFGEGVLELARQAEEVALWRAELQSTATGTADRLGRGAHDQPVRLLPRLLPRRPRSTRRRSAGRFRSRPRGARAADRAGEGRARRGGVRAAVRRAARQVEPDGADRRAVRRRATRTRRWSTPCARARDAGVRTALVSNSWGVHRYPHELFDELFDGVVISARGGHPQALAADVRAGRRARRRASRRRACTSTTCPSTSPRPRSWAWRPCTTRAPRRRSPSSSGCSGSPARASARDRRRGPVLVALAAPVEQLEQRPPAAARCAAL